MRIRAKYVDMRIASGRGVAERWLRQYRQDGRWISAPLCVSRGTTSEQIYNSLCALGDNPPVDKVAEIIGNKSWSYLTCDGCTSYVERAVSMGEYEPKAYCETCIKEACTVLGDAA